MHVDVKGLSVYVDAELIADPLYDIGWKDNHARTKTQGFEFLAIGLTPVTEGPGGDSSVIGDLLSCHCFHKVLILNYQPPRFPLRGRREGRCDGLFAR